MSFFYHNNGLQVENLPVQDIVNAHGTPCYIYSRAELSKQWNAFSSALSEYPHQICYAIKANANLSVLAILSKLGAGFDIVSGGELSRVVAVGGNPERSVFSGIGKSHAEIKQALRAGIGCFNVESRAELLRIELEARHAHTVAPIALRINPNIDADTHPYITTGLKTSKFGVEQDEALALYRLAASSKSLRICGIACHLGSQLTRLEPFSRAIEQLLALHRQLQKEHIHLQTINVGGGLGIAYQRENVPTIQEYCACILKTLSASDARLHLIVEPGRALIAKAGILVTRVEYIKRSAHKNFLIVDAGMNDLLRPALYDAQHTIQSLQLQPETPECTYDVVGPVCESSDYLGRNRKLRVQAGDYLAIMNCGAYAFSMSSNYNSRPRACEIMVDQHKTTLIRSRETMEQTLADEQDCLAT